MPIVGAMNPDTFLTAADLVQLISDVASPIDVLKDELDVGSAQTGFCTSCLPRTVALAANVQWLMLGNDSPNVSCMIATPAVVKLAKDKLRKVVIVYEDAAEAFHCLHNHAIHRRTYPKLTDPRVDIAHSARIEETAVVQGSVTIGENVWIGHGCVIRGPATIGEDTQIHENCTIGSAGLFSKRIAGKLRHVQHFGGVSIGSNCHLHVGVNVARSVGFGHVTQLENDVSIGPRANVGHDSFVGRESVLSASAALMGRTRIGAECWIGAGAMVSNGIEVGDGARIRLGAVVVQDVAAGADVSGYFARPHRSMLRGMLES